MILLQEIKKNSLDENLVRKAILNLIILCQSNCK